jgi:predicted 3-demethylubiquinone-9 3-methyltransferase (glyoxalase superfamily)
MSKIEPNLWFDTEAEEAANFYVDVFKSMGQTASVGRVLHYGESGPRPAGMVLTVQFALAGQDFVAINGGPDYPFTPAISMSVQCKDQAEVDGFWEKLTAGGKEIQCGWLTDRFGLSWQVVPTILIDMLASPHRGRAERAMAAMLKMVKINVEELQRAYDG